MNATKYTSISQMIKAGDYDSIKANLESRNDAGLAQLKEIESNGMKTIDALLFFATKHQTPRQGDIISILVEYGADINISDKNGITILMSACANNNKEMVAALLQIPSLKKDKLDNSGQSTAMHYAVKDDAIDCFDLLVADGADVNYVCMMTGRNYLHIACAEGSEKIVDRLISLGVDPTLEDALESAVPAEYVPSSEKFNSLFEKVKEYQEKQTNTVDPFAF